MQRLLLSADVNSPKMILITICLLFSEKPWPEHCDSNNMENIQ